MANVQIRWGILTSPTHASYERPLNNEAFMLYIFFGQDKRPRGHVMIPALPYLIGLFLGQEEPPNTPYKGRYVHKGGRFVCVGNPHPHETVISEFDLTAASQASFGQDEVPIISGLTLGVDPFFSGNQGKAATYLLSIEFLQ